MKVHSAHYGKLFSTKIYLLKFRVPAFLQIPLCNFRRAPARTTRIPAATRAKFSPINFILKRRATVLFSYTWSVLDWYSPKVMQYSLLSILLKVVPRRVLPHRPATSLAVFPLHSTPCTLLHIHIMTPLGAHRNIVNVQWYPR